MTHCRPALSEAVPILTEHSRAPSQHSLLGLHHQPLHRATPLSRPSASSSRHGNSMAPVPRTGHVLMHRSALGRQRASASRLAQRSLYSCDPRHLIAATPIVDRRRKPPEFRWNPGGRARRRRDLNPRGAMHPYLLSREAHSTGLCDVSSADYFRAFLPRARTCARRSARGRSTARRARDSNPRCHC